MWNVIAQVSSVFSLLAFLAAALVTILGRRAKHRENLVRSAPEKERTALVAAALDRVAVETRDLSQERRQELALKEMERRAERLRWVTIAAVTVLVSSGLLATTAYLKRSPDLYRVRVTVLDDQGQPTDGTRIRSSLGGEQQPLPGGWEIEIPAAKRPADGKLTLWATKKSAFIAGRAELVLGDELNPAVTLQLEEEEETGVRGLVVDEKGDPVAGARVLVVGYGEEAVVTRDDGGFVLPAHAAVGEDVRLQVTHPEFRTRAQYHSAGQEPATIVLREP